MKPVWIKYCGLIPMTRRGYLVTLTMSGLLAVLLILFLAAQGHLPPLRTLWSPDPRIDQLGPSGWLTNRMWLIILICIAAQGLDTLIMFRRFRQKEAEQRAQEEAGPKAAASQEPPTLAESSGQVTLHAAKPAVQEKKQS